MYNLYFRTNGPGSKNKNWMSWSKRTTKSKTMAWNKSGRESTSNWKSKIRIHFILSCPNRSKETILYWFYRGTLLEHASKSPNMTKNRWKERSLFSRFLHQNTLQLTQKLNLFPRKSFSRRPHSIVSTDDLNGTDAVRATKRIKRTFMMSNVNSKKVFLKIIIQFIHLSNGASREWQR